MLNASDCQRSYIVLPEGSTADALINTVEMREV